LETMEVRVNALARDELRVCSGLNNFAVAHRHDEVGFLDGGKAMRDANGGAANHEFFERFLDSAFGFVVEGAGGFIEN
jgi:hypothetical protein